MNTTTTTLERDQPRGAVATAELLLAALERIEVEGWDRETGRAVLDYAMKHVVRPAVRAVGCTGSDAEYAEATGWSAAWEALSAGSLRSAASPWGVVTAAVRYAVLNERMAETYGTDSRSAWRVHRFTKTSGTSGRQVAGDWLKVADPAALTRPVSLTAMCDAGYDQPAAPAPLDGSGRCLPAITDLLVRHGWRRELAGAAVLHIADHARQNPAGAPKAHGWREMSLELGIPPWRARRVTVLLLGAPGWPGLVERVATGGVAALSGPAIAAAVRATSDASMRPPARAALAIDARPARQPALAS
jgi:hypothetical protein